MAAHILFELSTWNKFNQLENRHGISNRHFFFDRHGMGGSNGWRMCVYFIQSLSIISLTVHWQDPIWVQTKSWFRFHGEKFLFGIKNQLLITGMITQTECLPALTGSQMCMEPYACAKTYAEGTIQALLSRDARRGGSDPLRPKCSQCKTFQSKI